MDELNTIVKSITGFSDQIQHWPIAVLIIVVCNIFGWGLKMSPCPNAMIPLVVVIGLGPLLGWALGDPGTVQFHVSCPGVVLALYGMIYGFIAWVLHMTIWKRIIDKKLLAGSTGLTPTEPMSGQDKTNDKGK